jgi:transposase InsO family protein
VYFYYQHHEETKHSDRDLIKEIKVIKEDNPAYGYRRVHLELKNCGWHLYDYQSFEEVAQAAADWISYYNNDRIKEKLGGKSPIRYRVLTTEKSA